MEFIQLKAGKDDEGRRLDRIARTLLADENLSQLYKALRSGLIKVNKKKTKGEYRIQPGDEIQVAAFLSKNIKNVIQKSPLTKKTLPEDWVILRTDSLLFLNKPYDINVQKAGKNDRALNELVQEDYLSFHQKKDEASLSFKTGPLHRLDRRTTGLITFSQNLEGARWFSEAMKTHSIKKNYLAIVEGKLEKHEIWTEKISKGEEKASDSIKFHTVSVNFDDDNSKDSRTEAVPLAQGLYRGKPVTLVNFLISTGRTHQIRSTSAFHSHPLLGDTAYGAEPVSEKQQLFLHSWSLEFPKNPLGLPEKLTCPPGEIFVSVLKSALINLPPEL
ncbi:RluA family pseudouridine synthase [uncultured Treponema sp.]|uniref:RluA family pseudouridine synthase n=1 Tax=uncultured Treponema sp. TaxID=162155 RepID=UPI0015BE49B0|nr:RluA family pseudouridine synthase [uncultured Treponema sp.]